MYLCVYALVCTCDKFSKMASTMTNRPTSTPSFLHFSTHNEMCRGVLFVCLRNSRTPGQWYQKLNTQPANEAPPAIPHVGVALEQFSQKKKRKKNENKHNKLQKKRSKTRLKEEKENKKRRAAPWGQRSGKNGAGGWSAFDVSVKFTLGSPPSVPRPRSTH